MVFVKLESQTTLCRAAAIEVQFSCLKTLISHANVIAAIVQRSVSVTTLRLLGVKALLIGAT